MEKSMTALEKATRMVQERRREVLSFAERQSNNGQHQLAIETLSRATGIGEALEILKGELLNEGGGK